MGGWVKDSSNIKKKAAEGEEKLPLFWHTSTGTIIMDCPYLDCPFMDYSNWIIILVISI
jgi:hypothetical protein